MSCVIIPCREIFYCLPRGFLLPAERIFTACRENFYSLPREIFFPAERVKKDRAHPIFGVIYIQGDISRQLAPKGQLSTAQGTALGIRYLRTMRPANGSSNVPLFFLQLPLQGALVVYIRLPRAMPWAMDDIGLSARTGYGRYWAFLLRQAAKPSAARQPHFVLHLPLHIPHETKKSITPYSA